jgi:hypothetical protein
MPKGLKYLIIFTIIFSIPIVSYGQYRRPKVKRYRKNTSFWDGFSVSGMVGVNMFYGDLVDKSRTSFSGGAIAEKELNTYLSGRLQLFGGKMKGEQHTTNDILSASFTNMYIDAALGLSFRPLDAIFGYFKQRFFNPYIFGQLGMIYYDATESFYDGYPVPNRPDRTLSGVHATFSMGPGVSIWLTNRISLKAELTGYFIFGDEVDGHKEWESSDGTIHQTDDNDYFYTYTLGITYLINDARWRNSPKYNRKAYLRTRGGGSYKHKSYRKKRRRR